MLVTISMACLYKFTLECNGLEATTFKILPSWTLFLLPALTRESLAQGPLLH